MTKKKPAAAKKTTKKVECPKYHRVVIQLQDTTINRKAMDKLMAGVRGLLGEVQGPNACIKRELVCLVSLFFDAPKPKKP